MSRALRRWLRHALPLLAALAWLLQVSLPGLFAAPAHPSPAAAAAVALGWCSSGASTADRATVAATADDSTCATGCCVAGAGTPPVPMVATATVADAVRPWGAGWRGALARWSGPARVRGPPAGNA